MHISAKEYIKNINTFTWVQSIQAAKGAVKIFLFADFMVLDAGLCIWNCPYNTTSFQNCLCNFVTPILARVYL